MNVFTYGTLMYPQIWERVVQGQYRKCSGEIQGYSRYTMIGADYPGLVVSNPADVVKGIVYFAIHDEDFLRLDAFETRAYARVRETVKLDNGENTECAVYVIKQEYEGLVSDVTWSEELFLKEGLKRFLK